MQLLFWFLSSIIVQIITIGKEIIEKFIGKYKSKRKNWDSNVSHNKNGGLRRWERRKKKEEREKRLSGKFRMVV